MRFSTMPWHASHYEAEDDMTVLVCGLYRKPENYSGA